MRFTGQIKIWNEEKGFGFITPDGGGQDIFVHISELPRSITPMVGQRYGFEVALNPQGKKKAIGVYVEGAESGRASASRRTRATPASKSSEIGFLGGATLIVVLAGIVFGVYKHQAARHSLMPESSSSAFKCDGRAHCSQMTSCKEAKFFLNYCPGVQMDGDNDGIPCEQQLCTGILDSLLR
jgi:cold shock CspA family protein